uniref:Uncharacterized protein n=1 Tax=Anguilla anguilla TaxID=7936 RepID=A0A0E9RP54_ANGAN
MKYAIYTEANIQSSLYLDRDTVTQISFGSVVQHIQTEMKQ